MGNGFFSGNIKIQEVNNFRFIGWAFIVYFFVFTLILLPWITISHQRTYRCRLKREKRIAPKRKICYHEYKGSYLYNLKKNHGSIGMGKSQRYQAAVDGSYAA